MDASQPMHTSYLMVTLSGYLPGVVSGLAKCLIGHPFDTIKVRMQTEGYLGRFSGPWDCVRQTVSKEGLRGLYKGMTPPLAGWYLIDSTMWTAREYTLHVMEQRQGHPISIPQHYIAGSIAGLASVLIVTPVEQIKARLQIQYNGPSEARYRGPIHCATQLVRNNGFLGLYKGFRATCLFRVFMGIYFGSYEYFRALFSRHMSSTKATFFAGGMAANALWLTSYPTDVIKNRMMSQPDVVPRKYKVRLFLNRFAAFRSLGQQQNVAHCVSQMYHLEGFKSFYRGFVPCMLRGFPTNAVAFSVAEAVRSRIKQK